MRNSECGIKKHARVLIPQSEFRIPHWGSNAHRREPLQDLPPARRSGSRAQRTEPGGEDRRVPEHRRRLRFGKSTLLHLLGTLDAPDSGTINLDGKRIDNLPAGERVSCATAPSATFSSSTTCSPNSTRSITSSCPPTSATRPRAGGSRDRSGVPGPRSCSIASASRTGSSTGRARTLRRRDAADGRRRAPHEPARPPRR